MKTKFNGILTLFLAFVVQIAFAQDRTISGTVSDETGPLPGVSVLKKGTTQGTETDFDGKYSIKAKTGDVLVFSFVGMETQEKTVGNSNNINTSMQSGNVLEEVVITGVGISRSKKAAGFSSQGVDSKELNKASETDISTALAGKVSGVQFTGQPTTSFNNSDIRLRGNTGVLYVVDGVKVGSRSDFNPNDIEDLQVLKGLSATSLYGPDGKNGVIVITTKRAASGQSSITLNTSYSFDKIYKLPEYQNEYGGGYNNYYNAPTSNFYGAGGTPEYYADESWGPKLDGQLVRHWDSWIPGTPEYGKTRPWSANPDNVRDFYRVGGTSNTNVSFAKSGEGFNIRTSLTRIDRESAVPNASRNTTQFAVNTSYDLNDKFTLYGNFNYQNRNTDNNPDSGYNNLGSNFNQWWQRQLDIKRLKNYKVNGQIVSWNMNSPTDPKPLYWDSPYFEVYENLKRQEKEAFYGKIGLNYQFNDNLDASIEIRKSFNNYRFNDRRAFGGLNSSTDGKPWYSENQDKSITDVLYGIANFQKDFEKIDFNANVGFEFQTDKYHSVGGSTVGGLAIKDFYSLASSIDRPNIFNETRKNKQNAVFLRTSFGYDDTVFLEGNVRRDWSSTATPDKDYVDTFGLSGSFVFSKLLPQNDILSFGKLRAGYASAPAFPNRYQIYESFNLGTAYGSYGTEYLNSNSHNPYLRGGDRTEFEIGGELKFLSNRLGLDLTYFNRLDKNIPVPISYDGGTGVTGQTVNAGQQTYNGFEVSLNGTPVKSENFTWDMNLNFATLERKVDKLYTAPNGQEVTTNVLSSSWRGIQLREEVGKEWGAIYGRKIRRDKNGNEILNSQGGVQFDSNQYLGNVLPDFTGGFSNTLNYKGLELSFSFDFQKGGKIFSVTDMFTHYSGLSKNTVGNNKLGNPVRNPVDGGFYAEFVSEANASDETGGVFVSGVDNDGNPISGYRNVASYWTGYFALHERWLHDATYVKLRTVRLGYNLPKSIIENTPFTNVNFAVFGNNVWLIHSEIEGLDPSEIEGQSGVNWIEGGQTPSSRSFGANLTLTF